MDVSNWNFNEKEVKKNFWVNTFKYIYQKSIECRLVKKYDGRYVAMFHQIANDKTEWYDKRYAISFESFKEYVNEVQLRGYKIVSPYDIIRSDGRKKIVLSFDDVFDGVYHYVYPFLKHKEIPFVIFPTINKMNEKGFINERMLKEMSNEYEGCYIGAHGISHCNLRGISKQECVKEIIDSGKKLESLLGREIDLFAYPYGSIDAVGKREKAIASQKYIIAFGTLQGGVTNQADIMYIPRINLNEENCYEHIMEMRNYY